MTLLILYCFLFIGIGIYEYIKHKDFEEFVVAGRRYGAGVVGVSIVASCVGASATIGMTGLAFSSGTPAFWWLGSGAVGLLVLSTLLARKVRRSNVFTLPDMAEKFISPSSTQEYGTDHHPGMDIHSRGAVYCSRQNCRYSFRNGVFNCSCGRCHIHHWLHCARRPKFNS